ncbi:unnamed protein product [Trichobilharzia regenti]|nr:unnamed protein product [Trichobilharzia regenti]
MSNICPRLIDYFVFVGSRSPGDGSSVLSPEILCRFPPTDHEDFPLPADVSFFCQPEGCVNSTSSTFPIKTVDGGSNHGIKSMTFLFSLTDKDSSKTRYGICTNFLRPVSFYASNKDTSCDSKFDYQHGAAFTNGPSGSGDNPNIIRASPPDNGAEPSKNASRNYSLTSICLITHYPFATTFTRLVQCVHTVLKKLHKLSKSYCVER